MHNMNKNCLVIINPVKDYAKRLFIDSPVYTITEEELLWLLQGLKIEDIRHYKKVVSEQ